MSVRKDDAGQGKAVTRWRPWAMASLSSLILLNLAQVAAGFSGISPSPPTNVLPFIVATAALGVFALILVSADQKAGYWSGVAFALISVVGMGPHKLLMEDGLVIAPVALLGFTFVLLFIWVAVKCLRSNWRGTDNASIGLRDVN